MVFSGTSIWLTSIIIYQLFLQDNIELLSKTLIVYMDVSENRGTPKSSILIGFSIINHPFWGTPIFGTTHIRIYQIGFFVRSWSTFLPTTWGPHFFVCIYLSMKNVATFSGGFIFRKISPLHQQEDDENVIFQEINPLKNLPSREWGNEILGDPSKLKMFLSCIHIYMDT